jgi:hypothetical protein
MSLRIATVMEGCEMTALTAVVHGVLCLISLRIAMQEKKVVVLVVVVVVLVVQVTNCDRLNKM